MSNASNTSNRRYGGYVCLSCGIKNVNVRGNNCPGCALLKLIEADAASKIQKAHRKKAKKQNTNKKKTTKK